MDNMIIAGGVGALVLGFIIGNVTAGGGPEFADPGPKLGAIESQIAELAAGNKATGDAVAALSARFDASDAAVQSVGGQVESVTTQIGAFEEKMGSGLSAFEESVGSNLSSLTDQIGAGFSSIEGAVSAQSDNLTAGIANLAKAPAASDSQAGATATAAVAAVAATAVAAVAGTKADSEESLENVEAPAQEAKADAAVEEEAAKVETATVESFSVGRTANLAGGEIRAFVSRVNGDDGLAEVAVNGLDRLALSAGQATAFEGSSGAACLLSLAGIKDGAAELAAACGDDRPEAQGVAPGNTAQLASGVSAFVSYGAANMARIAVNGQATTLVPVGKSTEVSGKSCSVKVEGVDRGRVALSTDC